AHRVVDGNELGLGLDQGQGFGDRLEALAAAVDDLHVHEGDVGLVTAAKHLAVFGRDDQDALTDVVAGDELFDGAQPDGAAGEEGERFLRAVLEARGLAGGGEDDGKLRHGTPRHGKTDAARTVAPTSWPVVMIPQRPWPLPVVAAFLRRRATSLPEQPPP